MCPGWPQTYCVAEYGLEHLVLPLSSLKHWPVPHWAWMFCFALLYFESGSHYVGPGGPGTYHVDQAGFELPHIGLTASVGLAQLAVCF